MGKKCNSIRPKQGRLLTVVLKLIYGVIERERYLPQTNRFVEGSAGGGLN